MPPKKMRVLVFPCGSENGLEIHDALRYSIHVQLIGASSVEDHGRFRFRDYVGGLPNIADKEFDGAFSALLRSKSIDVGFATHDSILNYLAPRAGAMGFHLINGDPRTASITRSKRATYETFADCRWAPTIYRDGREVLTWPVIVKPDQGQGGQGVSLAATPADVDRLQESMPGSVVMEHLPGQEITVDCFTDRNRELVWIGPRTRERVRAGIAMRCSSIPIDAELREIAHEVNRRLVMRGPWFLQLKQDRRGSLKLLEVCARVGGAMVTQRARGINLPLMALHDYMDRPVVALPLPQVSLIERSIATVARLDYEFETVFVDLDDTLIVDGKANPVVLAYLYQELREGKSLKLITRHAEDVAVTLRRARIFADMFDEVIHLRDGEPKAEHVKAGSIFIDNHFPERIAVASRWGIPVFDVDALQFLIR